MTKPGVANLTDSLGYDVLKLWATSFTVDEHEAFAIAYRALGGRVPLDDVRLSFHRHGFRRAGQGVMPRRWLKPFNIPSEAPLPTYHPKLILAETSERRHALFVSTANLATDDLRHSLNLVVRLDLSPSIAQRVARWIEHPPANHRALCLLVSDGNCTMIQPGHNRSTLEQIVGRFQRCSHCAKGARGGRWIVAAPFWSPATISELLRLESNGYIEAYFRIRTIWDQVAAGLHRTPELVQRVAAYELREGGHAARWHHKVLAWRCCDRTGARTALYLGSANATVCGLVGRGQSINWEAGVLWLGGPDLWRHARDVARGGLRAIALGRPRSTGGAIPKTDDELGAAETEELRRVFSAHASRCIRVDRSSREVTRSARAAAPVRALGRRWRLDSLEVRLERQNQVRDLGRLKPGSSIRIPEAGRAQIRAVFRIDEAKSLGDDPGFADATIDLWELDPEPSRPAATTQSSIAAALIGLIGTASEPNGTSRLDQSVMLGAGPSDVRFPFAEFFSLEKRRPAAARAWLDRLIDSQEPALAQLPRHWRQIAAALAAQQ